MTYLLDVNALLAFGFARHTFHARVSEWIEAEGFPPLATCFITELGFVRVLAQSPAYGLDLHAAVTLLQRMKQRAGVTIDFFVDGNGIEHLPVWVRSPKHLTDGHLAELAAANHAAFATLDTRIPDAFQIP